MAPFPLTLCQSTPRVSMTIVSINDACVLVRDCGWQGPSHGRIMDGGRVHGLGRLSHSRRGLYSQSHAFNSRLPFTRLAAAATTLAAFGMRLKMVH